ncbi:hypothetical protein PUN28_020561 [Cardiocondyla obscurior]|uniref:Uncharacterized protein n=1 Tax=Cardiocondyla obscurior TaxID=286306 RepID=A0AAW2E6H9_9HYME
MTHLMLKKLPMEIGVARNRNRYTLNPLTRIHWRAKSSRSNTRLGDFATPPADSSESSRKATRGSGTLPLRRPTAQRARESNTRLGDFATPSAYIRAASKFHRRRPYRRALTVRRRPPGRSVRYCKSN